MSAVYSKMRQLERWKRVGDGEYSISIGSPYSHCHVALCGLEWCCSWGIPEDSWWYWIHMHIGPQRIHRWVRENRRSCWRAASFGTCQRPFANFTTSLCTFSNSSASRDAWMANVQDNNFVEGEKNWCYAQSKLRKLKQVDILFFLNQGMRLFISYVLTVNIHGLLSLIVRLHGPQSDEPNSKCAAKNCNGN